MVSQLDQPRPDLDAAIDAVVPALTAVSDEAAADSRRRTRTALAEPRHAGRFVGWRWAVPAAALVAMGIATAFAWWPRAPIDAPRGMVVHTPPHVPATPLPAAKPATVASTAVAPRAVRPQRLARTARVEATSAALADGPSRTDRLRAFVQAVQQIPEDAWSRSLARADAPVIVPDVPITSIDVTPLASPADVAIEPLAPGEP